MNQNDSYLTYDIRDSAVLTNSYVYSKIIGTTNQDIFAGNFLQGEVSKSNQLEIDVIYTKGGLTSCELKIETSVNGIDWVQQTSKAISSGTATLTPLEYTYSGSSNFSIATPITARYIRVAVKGTGLVSGSLLKLVAKIGWR